MDDPLSQGHAFVFDDLWRASTLLRHSDGGTGLLNLDDPLPALEKNGDPQNGIFDFHIPDIAMQEVSLESPVDLGDLSTSPVASRQPDELDTNIWDLKSVINGERGAPALRTWEPFEQKATSNSTSYALVSEAGPAVFDAFISSLEPRDEAGVLPRDYTLRALCNLALGRASSLFQWDDSKKSFVQTLAGVSVSGSSRMCSESFVQDLIGMGTTFASLRNFAAGPRPLLSTCTAVIAMQKSISEMLDIVDEGCSTRFAGVRSLMQLHSLVQQAGRLISVLRSLSQAVEGRTSDEAVISSLSDRIHLEVQLAPEFRPVLHALLTTTSSPWLEQLAFELGFSSPAKVLSGDSSSHDARMDAAFVSPEDRDLIHQTRLAVGVLRAQASAHPLLTRGAIGQDSPSSCFSALGDYRDHIQQVADTYNAEVLHQLRGERVPRIKQAALKSEPSMYLDDQIWHDDAFRADYFSTLEAEMSSDSIGKACASDPFLKTQILSSCFASRTKPEDVTACTGALLIDSSFAPLEYVRPLIETQKRLVNGVLMRQLLRDHKLKEHLEVQRAFHLLGNGEFVSRLSIALFSQDVQSSERRRGKLPTSEEMGLRLGTTHEERWPPASSELQLTLVGILQEAFKGRKVQQRTLVQTEDLPGSLSFAIRELPEAEIDRVLDPNSIYALDFLRLQYTAKAPLNAILTASALQKYDDIFKYLLRLLRVIHVTADLGRKAAARRNETDNEHAVLFSHTAHQFVCTLLSHIMDVGVESPWRDFSQTISRVDQTLIEEDAADEIGTKATIGITGLRQLHDAFLGRVRNRLFLKRRQEKLRNAVESTLAALLTCAFAIHHEEGKQMLAFVAEYDRFRQELSAFHTALQEQAEKPPKAVASDELEDAELLRLLLIRLNWNDFF